MLSAGMRTVRVIFWEIKVPATLSPFVVDTFSLIMKNRPLGAFPIGLPSSSSTGVTRFKTPHVASSRATGRTRALFC